MTVKPCIVVFEKEPRWDPELKRQFLGEDVLVRACRSVSDIESKSENAEQTVIVLDLKAEPENCLQFLGQSMGGSPGPPVIVIGSSRVLELEWPVRELGAVEFLADSVSGEDLAKLCKRQWSHERV
jgi:DNA-binding NtrC family response regulator